MKRSLKALVRSFSTHSGPPIRVAFTPDAGRGVFATRSISGGEIIHTAEPLITHPSLQNLSKACFFCLKRLAHSFPPRDVALHANDVHSHFLEGSTCQQPKFCSQNCSDSAKAFYTLEKKADWKNFHQFCSQEGLRRPLLAKRLVCMVLSGMVSRDALDILSYVKPPHDIASCWMHTRTMLLDGLKGSGVSEDQLACILKIALQDSIYIIACHKTWASCSNISHIHLVGRISHPRVRVFHIIHIGYGQLAVMSINNTLRKTWVCCFVAHSWLNFVFEIRVKLAVFNLLVVSDEWYCGVLARISLNAFRVELLAEDSSNLLAAAVASVSGDAISGSAVYILPSMYNHDCDPNVDISWPTNATVHLSARRDIEQGEELRITYIDASMSQPSRQQLLKQAYHFECNCSRCKDEE